MKEFTYVVTDENGIHARPAGLLVKAASGYSCEIIIKKGESKADAKRIFSLMGLGIKNGDEITVICDGADESEASKVLESFLRENL